MNQAIDKNQKIDDHEAEILYQKINGQWYAFSVIDDEVFYGRVSDDQINKQVNSSNLEAADPVSDIQQPPSHSVVDALSRIIRKPD